MPNVNVYIVAYRCYIIWSSWFHYIGI